ncbi:PEP-CTERM sorting domain-containing protein [Luteolibacter yonseiensis]|uniref:PEP-CTERM sorting domain-containing protein n=1 Tax=Luteolibacter yonseiensis TaxID=1144680 RepID=A0A934VAS1_9BACT|nr:PEP-CTERM sorting domain-containing protein [Luteolibacter yonseiensis]MBK1816488.1 PEP-CTERM sorting domain-containing protein [Luteolibacter yonseiensis]
MNQPIRLAILAAAIILPTAGAASAAVLASDVFNYPAGTFSTDAWNGGTGWSGAWRDSSNNATYDPSIGTDGRLHTESANAADRHKGVVRTLSDSYNVAEDGTLWASVSMSVNSVGETGQYAWLSFMNGTAEPFRFGRHDATNTHWGLQASTNVPGTSPGSTIVFGRIDTLLFKMEYVGGNTIYSLWVNPTGSETDLGTPDSTLTRAGSLVFDGIRMQSRASATFDDFTLGTTFSDVVPEPSSLLMAVSGSLLLLSRKRRRA